MSKRYPWRCCRHERPEWPYFAVVVVLLLSFASSTLWTVRGFSPTSVNSRAVAMRQMATTTSSKTTTTSSANGIFGVRVTLQAASTTNDETMEKESESATSLSIWEEAAKSFVSQDFATNPYELKQYVQYVTLLRVGIPALALGATAGAVYPSLSLYLASLINDYPAFSVIANDNSQYIQNILTTCGLTFSILVGQTYYFMYQQQEEIYYALFEEVTVAKLLLEQVALVCQGRKAMYQSILKSIDKYVQNDLLQTATEPAVLLSKKPMDDPFERVMFLTSVGEPSIIYKTVRTLRQARAHRLGALQKKLPPIHMILLYSLAGVVLCTFPVLGAGVQTLGGMAILKVQSVYLAFIVFGITMTLGIVNELRQPAGKGAYNVVSVLTVMVEGLEEELEGRMSGKYSARKSQELSPTVDPDPVLIVQQPKIMLEAVVVEEDEQKEANEVESSTNDSISGGDAKHTKEEENHVAHKEEWIGKRIVRKIRNR